MKRIIIAGLLALTTLPAFAANVVTAPAPASTKTPGISWSGSEVDQMLSDLTHPSIFLKQQDGSLVPVIDDNVKNAIRMIVAKVRAEQMAAAHQAVKPPKRSAVKPPNVAPSAGK